MRTVDLECVEVECTTDHAILCKYEEGEAWIPKSQIAEESELDPLSEKGDVGTLVIPEWLAIAKGLV